MYKYVYVYSYGSYVYVVILDGVVLQAADLRDFKPCFPLEAKEGLISTWEEIVMGSLTCICRSYSLLLSGSHRVPHSGKASAEKKQLAWRCEWVGLRSQRGERSGRHWKELSIYVYARGRGQDIFGKVGNMTSIQWVIPHCPLIPFAYHFSKPVLLSGCCLFQSHRLPSVAAGASCSMPTHTRRGRAYLQRLWFSQCWQVPLPVLKRAAGTLATFTALRLL